MRAVCSHPDPTDPETKGKLPKHILQPIFKDDPSHRVKVVAIKWYKLKAQPVSQSTMTGELAGRLKRSWGYMIKQHRNGTIEDFVEAAKAPLNHTFNNHQFCGDWCQAVKAQKENKVYHNPRGWHSRETEKGKKLYQQIQAVTKKYGSKFYVLQSLHRFDTQTNESLNQTQAYLTPKCKVFHSSKSFHYRHAINVGCHNMGFDRFWTTLFDEIGLPQTKLLRLFVQKFQWRRTYWREYKKISMLKG